MNPDEPSDRAMFCNSSPSLFRKNPIASLTHVACIFTTLLALTGADAAPKVDKAAKPAEPSPWAEWVEPDFPFFSSILDARHAGIAGKNLTPRGIVLNLGKDCWACFDVDLLRVAAVWRGPGVTAKALAPGSYHDSGRKTPGGQFPAPQPDGKLWLANGIYPGWQTGEHAVLEDPREPAPSPEEVGRGPLPVGLGKFKAVRIVREGVVLEYSAGGADIREWTTVSMREPKPVGKPTTEDASPVATQGLQPVIERHFEVGACAQPLLLIAGAKNNGAVEEVVASVMLSWPHAEHTAEIVEDAALWIVRVPAHEKAVRFCITIADSGEAPAVHPRAIPRDPPARRWPQEVVSNVKLSTAKDAYVVDDVALPLDNPWKRDVRIADIQFLKDGTGVGVTIDGDVWLIRGLAEKDGNVQWHRFASGLHEPMSVAIRDNEIFVFDRNGIWRLRDTTGFGEADVHELFSNAFAQTADMREFPNGIRLAPGGEFVIVKGGQQATTLGKHNGSVLQISADGASATVLGYGFRQPNIGVNVRTGLVTACDQEGQYVPSTPLYIVRDNEFHGFLSDLQPKEKYPAPIADPLTWIPHAVNASGVSQVWLFDAKMGALNDSLVHIGFNRPELFRVLFNNRTAKPQAAIVSITSALDFPPLNGSVNPADGQLYLAGFQVVGWGTTATRISGLGRVRYTGAPCTLPREIVPMDKGVLLRFDVPLNAKKAADPASYSLATFHYIRTFKYGSALYKEDGKTGQDFLAASSAYLSKDAQSVFIGVPGMKPVQQLRVGWSLATTSNVQRPTSNVQSQTLDVGRSLAFEGNAYTTPYKLAKFDPQAEGFGDITVDLTPRVATAQNAAPATAEEGRRLAQMFGCAACHSPEGKDMAHVGPTWKGLFGSERDYFNAEKKKGHTKADAAYLRESIIDPPAKIVAGYERGEYAMPSYAGALTDSQIESIILFIQALK
jgi:mono/diheme cytochrome c family protein